MPEIRELSKTRLAAIKAAEAEGSLGPFAPCPHPTDSQKLSPLNPSKGARQNMKNIQDRKSQEQELGMTRGRNAAYKGD